MTDEAIQEILYLLGAWERGANAHDYANEIEALRQALAQPEPWDTSDMAHRTGGLTVEQSIKERNT